MHTQRAQIGERRESKMKREKREKGENKRELGGGGG